MPDYRSLLNPLIKTVEGHQEDPYQDHKGNTTVGTGLNLEDADVQGLMKIRNIDPEEVKSGTRKLASDELDDIHNSYLDKREGLVRSKMGPDMFDMLQPNEKAAVMSMGYQSLNNLGPNFNSALAAGDKIGAMREMILNTNQDKSPGILARRLKEAELYGGPLDFTSTFKTFSPEEKQQVRSIIESTKNEHTKKELLDKYGSYLGEPDKLQFNKLQEMLKPKQSNLNE